jgi:hypothetical protein
MKLNAGLAEVYNNLGNTLTKLDRLEDAEKMYLKAVELKPDYSDAHYNLGHGFHELGKYQDAEEAYRQALRHNRDDVMAQWNLGLLKLLQGDFEEGLKLYECRFDRSDSKEFEPTIKIFGQLEDYDRWQGESLEGSSLLVICEQGIGDSLMMMRYLPLLKQMRLSRLTIYCHPTLLRIMHCMPGCDDVVPMREPLPFGRFDLYCPVMSLPYLFKTALDSIPTTLPYLLLPEVLKNRWKTRMAAATGLKAGLVWAGNKQACFDSIRSIPLTLFEPLLKVSGVNFFSLQKEDDLHQLKELNWNIIDCMAECEDFLDTAALVDQLDLIISVDTSVAHLAGAMGKPVWLLNRFESEWRWMLNRSDSPWYPSMKIFRQQKRNDWDAVIRQLGEELEGLCLNQKTELDRHQSDSGESYVL